MTSPWRHQDSGSRSGRLSPSAYLCLPLVISRSLPFLLFSLVLWFSLWFSLVLSSQSARALCPNAPKLGGKGAMVLSLVLSGSLSFFGQ